MDDTNMIDSCQARDTGVAIESEPHLNLTYKTSLLIAPLAVRVHNSCSAFPLYTPTKRLIQLHIQYKTLFFLNYNVYILEIYDKM